MCLAFYDLREKPAFPLKISFFVSAQKPAECCDLRGRDDLSEIQISMVLSMKKDEICLAFAQSSWVSET